MYITLYEVSRVPFLCTVAMCDYTSILTELVNFTPGKCHTAQYYKFVAYPALRYCSACIVYVVV